MSVAIEFPGTAVTISANTNGVNCVATLPAPAAGLLQRLDGFICTIDPAAAVTSTSVTISNIAGGANAVFNLTTGPGLPALLAYNFANGWPASATATSIIITITAIAANMRVTMFGHNEPQ